MSCRWHHFRRSPEALAPGQTALQLLHPWIHSSEHAVYGINCRPGTWRMRAACSSARSAALVSSISAIAASRASAMRCASARAASACSRCRHVSSMQVIWSKQQGSQHSCKTAWQSLLHQRRPFGLRVGGACKPTSQYQNSSRAVRTTQQPDCASYRGKLRHLDSRSFRSGARGCKLAPVRGDGGVQRCRGAVVLPLELLQTRLQLVVPANCDQHQPWNRASLLRFAANATSVGHPFVHDFCSLQPRMICIHSTLTSERSRGMSPCGKKAPTRSGK